MGLRADFRVGNVVELHEYTDCFFDFILDGLCLHCIIGRDRVSFLQNVNRVLKADGFFFVKTMCGDPVDEAVRKRFDPQTRCVMRDGPTGPFAERYHGLPDDILREIRQARFDILHWEIQGDDEESELLVEATKECEGILSYCHIEI